MKDGYDRKEIENYLKDLCISRHISYNLITGTKRTTTSVDQIRRQLMLDIKNKYPKLSTIKIGHYFNRSHATIIHNIRLAIKEKN